MSTQTRDEPVTLQGLILKIDQTQARRFSKLDDNASEIATQGIIRHFRACVRMNISPNRDAIREIIDGAIHGENLVAIVDDDKAYLIA